MIKVSIMYPTSPEARFDHDYYRDRHMPLVAELLGEACLRWTVDRGVNGGRHGIDPPYVAMCHIYSDSVDAFQEAFGASAKQIMADVGNYTDISPVMQISDVVVDG
ncbi:EthD family reductase [Luteipulveratus halotolerans]|uniref:Ethyl tert-butyl ether degradation protein EthD n=1 Tax=Luteipulveratus halotolerans TaxID=1631356 RepID=A0A0L6CPH7_9MICO|nr:EthD family reductase [Luteipulveratus halotolerans]KNX39550.1 ethyl tert-butyl ether degradation protein EthD [Luteipulveratus halotolerans]